MAIIRHEQKSQAEFHKAVYLVHYFSWYTQTIDLIDCCEPYSDDAKLFGHIVCPDDQLKLQSGVNLVQWTQWWFLNLNVKKV